jgi:hypothetical protein
MEGEVMEEKASQLQESRKRMEELMPEVYRTLNNWSLEPTWERAAFDWTAVLSDFLSREPDYLRTLEETLVKLAERMTELEKQAAR